MILQKKYYQKRFTNSALDLPPPKSKDLQNTITYCNNVVIQNKNVNTRNEIEDDDDVVITEYIQPYSIEVIEISDSEEDKTIDSTPELTNTNTESTESVLKTTDSNTKCTDKSDKEILESIDDIDDCDEIDSEDVSLDISNESLLLEILEIENNIKIKLENSNDSKLEYDMNDVKVKLENFNDIKLKNKELQTAINCSEVCNDRDNEKVNEIASLKCENNIIDIKTEVKGSQNNCVKVENYKDTSLNHNRELEINNNYNVIKDRNNSIVKQEVIETVKEKSLIQDSPDDDVFVKESSPTKRLRTDSENSETLAKKYKIGVAQTVNIAPHNYPEENISVDTVTEIKTFISKNITESAFLPLLKCHGVKNGGLIYSCYDQKSLVWLKNVISVASDLNLKVTDTDYRENENRRMKFKINSVDDVDHILHRLELYNADLKTDLWEVIDSQVHKDFIVISVIVDIHSFELIRRENFCLFAGVDLAEFSITFD